MSRPNTIQIIFQNPSNGATFPLKYRMFENPFVDRWLHALRRVLLDGTKIENNGNFFGAAFIDEARLRKEMSDCVRIINRFKKRSIAENLEPHPDMTNEFLLKLHGEFERLEPHPDFNSPKTPTKVRTALTQLNILIHQYQTLFAPEDCHIDINFTPVPRYRFEEPEHELFTTTRKWGTLYLAYGVTGVPVLDAFFADHRAAAVPQSNFTPGMSLYFSKDRESAKGPRLREWLKEAYGWDMDDPKLALGYIPLGEVDCDLSAAEIRARLKDHPSVKAVRIDPEPELRGPNPPLERFDSNRPALTPSLISTLTPSQAKDDDSLPLVHLRLENQMGTSRTELTYRLRAHGVSRRWVALMRESLTERSAHVMNEGKFYGFHLVTRSELARRASLEFQSLVELGFGRHTHLDLGALTSERTIEGMEGQALGETVGHLKSLDGKSSELTESVASHVRALIEIFNQMQSMFENEHEGHVNVDLSPVELVPLEVADYDLFSLDRAWGELSLAYGKVGLPPMNAFYGRSKDEFHPQTDIANGFVINFYPDSTFTDWEAWNAWLVERTGRTYSEHTALGAGAIPLGSLESVDGQPVASLERTYIASRIRQHPRVTRVSLIEAKDAEKPAAPSVNPRRPIRYEPSLDPSALSPAVWPSSREVFYHLEHTPWIFLPVGFDAAACVREAQALMSQAVVHRPYDQSGSAGNWKSLGIRALRGDKTKTENHTSYGVQEPDYELTEIAEVCPQTLRLIEQLTDIDSCFRIRFMFLEPGARIRVHSDAPDRDSAFALNVALNMPDGCEFHIDANPDGSHNEYTRKIPIEAGSAFILNNAKYHYLFNASEETRVHLIIHGPVRFSDSEILGFAREQNGFKDGKQLLNALIRKYASLGRDIATDSELFKDWLISGVCDSCLPPEVRVAALTSEDVEPELEKECLERITRASLFPLRPSIVKEKRLDAWLVQQVNAGGRFAVLIGSGTYVPSAGKFMIEIIRAISKLKASEAMVMGQIISRKDGSGALPFLHEQFVILDLHRWKRAGFTSLGKPYSDQPFEMAMFEESSEMVHDDYTPLWMKRSSSNAKRKGRDGFCTHLIHRSLELNRPVINVPLELRATKKFAYPRAGRDWQYREIRQAIGEFLERERDRVFVFNNENLVIPSYGDFRPDRLISVAAGMKPLSLLNQFWGERIPERVSLIDFSSRAIEHFGRLLRTEKMAGVVDVLSDELKYQSPGLKDSWAESRERLRTIINDVFDGSEANWLRAHQHLRRAELVNGDFIHDPSVVLSRLEKGRKTLFWHSNAWSSNVGYFIHAMSDLDEIYANLIREAQAKLGLSAWRRTWGFEVILGESLTSPQVIFTDGLSTRFQASEYRAL